VFYIHPWEVDPEQPRLDVGAVTRMRHYAGLGSTLRRLNRLLREFRFDSVANVLNLGPAGTPDALDDVWPAPASDRAGAPQ
jgi:hypothetical protein